MRSWRQKHCRQEVHGRGVGTAVTASPLAAQGFCLPLEDDPMDELQEELRPACGEMAEPAWVWSFAGSCRSRYQISKSCRPVGKDELKCHRIPKNPASSGAVRYLRKKAKSDPRQQLIKLGSPLPQMGACRHFKKSYKPLGQLACMLSLQPLARLQKGLIA